MLSRIHIRNLVIVRSLDLVFAEGMTALTGETGAGKSILIDALGLALGDKTDNSMIGAGAPKAEISVAFEIAADSPAATWLQQHDLEHEDECLLRRVLVRDGRSRAYINGTPAPLATLRELGEMLIDIHGQHAHQSLLRAGAQRRLLDDYADLRGDTRRLAGQYQAWRHARKEFESLRQAGEDRANRLDYLRFQIDELAAVACDRERLQALEAEQGRLAHAERLLCDSSAILDMLSEQEPSILQSLNRATNTLAQLSQLDVGLSGTHELLETAGIQLEEAVSSLRHYQDGVELDPERLQLVDQQLGALHDLARKHRVPVSDLAGLLDDLRTEAQDLENADDRLLELERSMRDSEAAYFEAAAKLGTARRKAAAHLSKTVTDSLHDLGMQDGRFDIACEADDDNPAPHGLDRVRFLVAANPGQPLAALEEVASGGELSRISLAIQVATVDCGVVPTLIFDEVDVGIGGAVAEIVGQLLRRLGDRRQVLCVTHLPQVASQAHQQLRVLKLSDGKTTETNIEALDDKARVDEIARMLGGIDITQQTRRHAQEMIRRAQMAS